MKKVISVRFKENGKSYYFDPGEAVIHAGEYVIVETARGVECGEVVQGELELGENQMEMCRFYLREGSALRDSYKNFADMSTEYDTVNLICATVAGVREKTLHPVVVRQFGEEIWNAKEKETSDFIFSYMIESNKGRMERQAITRYLQDKNRKESEKDLSVWDNNMIYTELERILRHRGVGRGKGYDRKMIYVE